MMIGEYWIIRHKPTGNVMDSGKRIRKGGYTHWEPDIQAFCPRLFHTEQAAKIALTWWLKGVSEVDYYTHWEYGTEEIGIKTTPEPRRKKEDMEVVKVTLNE